MSSVRCESAGRVVSCSVRIASALILTIKTCKVNHSGKKRLPDSAMQGFRQGRGLAQLKMWGMVGISEGLRVRTRNRRNIPRTPR